MMLLMRTMAYAVTSATFASTACARTPTAAAAHLAGAQTPTAASAHLAGAPVLHDCTQPPTAAAAHLAGKGESLGCESNRHPSHERGDQLFTFRRTLNEAQAQFWAAAVRSSGWWRERRQRDAHFGFDPNRWLEDTEVGPVEREPALFVQPVKGMRERPGDDGFIVGVRWSVPGTAAFGGSLTRQEGDPHGLAYLYFDRYARASGEASFEGAYLLLDQDAREPRQMYPSGAMQGDDGRWVLFGVESLAPEDDPDEHISAYGWISWFDGRSFRVERRTCPYRIPQ